MSVVAAKVSQSDPEMKSTSSVDDAEKGMDGAKTIVLREREASASGTYTEIDLFSYHEHNAGRLVVDPEYVYHLYSCSLASLPICR